MLELVTKHAGLACMTTIVGWKEGNNFATKTMNYGMLKTDEGVKYFDTYDPVAFKQEFCKPFTRWLREVVRGM